MDSNLKEKRPKELKDPILVNVFRTEFTEDKIILELGNIDDKTIDVISSVCFDPKMLYPIIAGLVNDGVIYENKYKIDIFPKKDANVKKESTGE